MYLKNTETHTQTINNIHFDAYAQYKFSIIYIKSILQSDQRLDPDLKFNLADVSSELTISIYHFMGS